MTEEGNAIGFWCGFTRDAAKHPTRHSRAPTTIIMCPKLSVAPRLRNSAAEQRFPHFSGHQNHLGGLLNQILPSTPTTLMI